MNPLDPIEIVKEAVAEVLAKNPRPASGVIEIDLPKEEDSLEAALSNRKKKVPWNPLVTVEANHLITLGKRIPVGNHNEVSAALFMGSVKALKNSKVHVHILDLQVLIEKAEKHTPAAPAEAPAPSAAPAETPAVTVGG